MIFPTVHLNGTAPEDLLHQYNQAYQSVESALSALALTCPHDRDYYVQADPQAGLMARGEHNQRMEKLRSVADDLMALSQSVFDQQQEREDRKLRVLMPVENPTIL